MPPPVLLETSDLKPRTDPPMIGSYPEPRTALIANHWLGLPTSLSLDSRRQCQRWDPLSTSSLTWQPRHQPRQHVGPTSGYQQKGRKPSQNDKTEHGMEKTVQNQGQSPKKSKSKSIQKNQHAEAEYRGVANVVAETAWVRNLLRELHSPLPTATLVYCDNVSVVYMSANPVQHQRTKHIEIDIHFVRDLVKAGHVRVLHVPSRFQYADIFTKGLPSALFEDFRSSLSVRPPPAQTAGAC
ncbi:ribonuclease H-like domain-containing protein [Tanacetum coccineum]